MGEKKIDLFGLKISTMGILETIEWIMNCKKGAKIYCCTLNEVVVVSENIKFKRALMAGSLLTADGMPLVWEMRRKIGEGERVYGPDLMKKLLVNCKEHLFVGDEKNKKYFEKRGEYIVLPYKKRFGETDYKMMVARIKKSRAKIVWVGLGAEKQIEVADNLAKLLPNKIYITVGAAFDFLSGNKNQAPRWMQESGLEWLFRLINEPKRLGRRYWKCGIFLSRYYGRELMVSLKNLVPGFKKD